MSPGGSCDFPIWMCHYLSRGSLILSSDLMVDFLSCVSLQVWPPASQAAPSTIHERKPIACICERERTLQVCCTHWTVGLEDHSSVGQPIVNFFLKKRGSCGVTTAPDQTGSLPGRHRKGWVVDGWGGWRSENTREGTDKDLFSLGVNV